MERILLHSLGALSLALLHRLHPRLPPAPVRLRRRRIPLPLGVALLGSLRGGRGVLARVCGLWRRYGLAYVFARVFWVVDTVISLRAVTR